MKLRFEVRSIKQKWKPPFTKDITDEIFDVEEGESFDKIQGNGNSDAVFVLMKNAGDKVVLKYSRLFTLKVPQPGDKIVTLKTDDPLSMTYMWGEDGITKRITYKGIAPAAVQKSDATQDETEKEEALEQEINEQEQIQ